MRKVWNSCCINGGELEGRKQLRGFWWSRKCGFNNGIVNVQSLVDFLQLHALPRWDTKNVKSCVDRNLGFLSRGHWEEDLRSWSFDSVRYKDHGGWAGWGRKPKEGRRRVVKGPGFQRLMSRCSRGERARRSGSLWSGGGILFWGFRGGVPLNEEVQNAAVGYDGWGPVVVLTPLELRRLSWPSAWAVISLKKMEGVMEGILGMERLWTKF